MLLPGASLCNIRVGLIQLQSKPELSSGSCQEDGRVNLVFEGQGLVEKHVQSTMPKSSGGHYGVYKPTTTLTLPSSPNTHINTEVIETKGSCES